MKNKRSCNRGFTLVEMALVLLILGVLTRAAIMPLAAVQEHKQINATTQQLEMIRESVIAYVVAHGALPCPAASIVGSYNDGLSECVLERGGVPATILGISGAVNQNGALLDAWNQPYVYAVSLSNHAQRGNQSQPDWTFAGEAAQVGVPHLSADIVICMQLQASNCTARNVRADQVAFVVLSHGADNSTAGLQYENQDDDQTFLLQAESITESERFDDQLVWATAADIMYWMLRMGWLP